MIRNSDFGDLADSASTFCMVKEIFRMKMYANEFQKLGIHPTEGNAPTRVKSIPSVDNISFAY